MFVELMRESLLLKKMIVARFLRGAQLGELMRWTLPECTLSCRYNIYI